MHAGLAVFNRVCDVGNAVIWRVFGDKQRRAVEGSRRYWRVGEEPEWLCASLDVCGIQNPPVAYMRDFRLCNVGGTHDALQFRQGSVYLDG